MVSLTAELTSELLLPEGCFTHIIFSSTKNDGMLWLEECRLARNKNSKRTSVAHQIANFKALSHFSVIKCRM